MFSVENLSNPTCIASPYTDHNPCGIMDAFGVWSKDEFLKFLAAVETKYGIKQAMIYEWQYVPKGWLSQKQSKKFNLCESAMKFKNKLSKFTKGIKE